LFITQRDGFKSKEVLKVSARNFQLRERVQSAMHKPSNLVKCLALRTVPRAKRPDAALNSTIEILMIGSLSAASGRFARGTVLMLLFVEALLIPLAGFLQLLDFSFY